MTDAFFYTAYDDMPPAIERLRRVGKPRRGYATLGMLCLMAAGVTALSVSPARGPGSLHLLPLAARHLSPLKVADALPVPSHVTDDPILLPAYIAGLPTAFAASHPVSSRFVFAAEATMAAVAEAPAPTVRHTEAVSASTETAVPGPQIMAAADDPEGDAVVPAVPTTSPLLATAEIPLPTPRPADLAPTVMREAPFRAARRATVLASAAPTTAASVAPDNRSFLEKFFSVGQQAPATNPALGYAAPETGFFSSLRGSVSNPARSYGESTAVYEIASHTVFMPDGSRLEAHSGLGSRLDDPRFVHESMRGPTPPATYALKMREALFHGVQALRLTPVGSSVFGRVGLLAHTYMLGPNGDSNGCVSFRNYKAFLQAFQNGDVRRLVVVARLS